jgi:hypothetical protein
MKKTIHILLFATIVVALSSCKPSKEEAIAYNDKIINEQVAMIDKINLLYDALKNYQDHYGMDFCYAEALKQVETSTAAVEKLDKFGGDTKFRDEALKLFATYKSVLQNELKKMVDMSKLSDDMYTTDVEKQFNDLADVSSKKMDDGLKALDEVQKEFATKYNFQIEKKKSEDIGSKLK